MIEIFSQTKECSYALHRQNQGRTNVSLPSGLPQQTDATCASPWARWRPLHQWNEGVQSTSRSLIKIAFLEWTLREVLLGSDVDTTSRSRRFLWGVSQAHPERKRDYLQSEGGSRRKCIILPYVADRNNCSLEERAAMLLESRKKVLRFPGHLAFGCVVFFRSNKIDYLNTNRINRAAHVQSNKKAEIR